MGAETTERGLGLVLSIWSGQRAPTRLPGLLNNLSTDLSCLDQHRCRFTIFFDVLLNTSIKFCERLEGESSKRRTGEFYRASEQGPVETPPVTNIGRRADA